MRKGEREEGRDMAWKMWGEIDEVEEETVVRKEHKDQSGARKEE